MLELKEPVYDDKQLIIDKEFVLKKLSFSETEFETYIKTPGIPHTQYGYEKGFFNTYPFLKPMKKFLSKFS